MASYNIPKVWSEKSKSRFKEITGNKQRVGRETGCSSDNEFILDIFQPEFKISLVNKRAWIPSRSTPN